MVRVNMSYSGAGLLVVMMTLVRQSLTASIESPLRDDVIAERAPRHARSLRTSGSTQATSEYAWLCPTAMCPPVSPNCRTVEYMVFEYDVLLGNRAVSVRCQTCEYCLDVPFRGRRSLFDTQGSNSRRHRCSHMHCPSTPAGCIDQRLTDVFLDDHFCKKCPACFDNTVVAANNL